MSKQCAYCNAFKKAFSNNDYCSIHGDLKPNPRGNTFYLKAEQMNSDWHTSRMTFRTALTGYQRYRLRDGQQEVMVNSSNYLVINNGQDYCNEIDSNTGAESFVVAFDQRLIPEVWASNHSGLNRCLDVEQAEGQPEVNFFNSSYTLKEPLISILYQLKTGILAQEANELFYDQLHYELAESLIENHYRAMMHVNRLSSVKKSTRLEIHRRLGVAKDFMSANFNKKLSLRSISQEGALSPYYFLKLFKSLYGETPFSYLTKQRLNYAQCLLRHTHSSLRDVTQKSGFEDTSAFIRLFKNRFGITPSVYRKSVSI